MGKKYYNQYFYTWLKAMDGAAVFASSDSENDKLMLKLCRGASEHDSGEKSHYRLIYDRGLKSFVFLRSVRMDHAIGGSERICNFIHAYQLDGEAESMADYLLPTYFSNGSGEDLCTKSLDKVMLDTSCTVLREIKISQDLLASLLYVLSFDIKEGKKRLCVKFENNDILESDFRAVTAFLYGLVPYAVRTGLRMGVSANHYSIDCNISLVTEEAVETSGRSYYTLACSDGTLRAEDTLSGALPMKMGICRYLASLAGDKALFDKESESFFKQCQEKKKRTPSGIDTSEEVVCFNFINSGKLCLTDYSSELLLNTLSFTLANGGVPEKLEKLVRNIAFHHIRTAQNGGTDIIARIFKMKLDSIQKPAEKLTAEILDELYADEATKAKALQIMREERDKDNRRADLIASYLKYDNFLDDIIGELSFERLAMICDSPVLRQSVFRETETNWKKIRELFAGEIRVPFSPAERNGQVAHGIALLKEYYPKWLDELKSTFYSTVKSNIENLQGIDREKYNNLLICCVNLVNLYGVDADNLWDTVTRAYQNGHFGDDMLKGFGNALCISQTECNALVKKKSQPQIQAVGGVFWPHLASSGTFSENSDEKQRINRLEESSAPHNVRQTLSGDSGQSARLTPEHRDLEHLLCERILNWRSINFAKSSMVDSLRELLSTIFRDVESGELYRDQRERLLGTAAEWLMEELKAKSGGHSAFDFGRELGVALVKTGEAYKDSRKAFLARLENEAPASDGSAAYFWYCFALAINNIGIRFERPSLEGISFSSLRGLFCGEHLDSLANISNKQHDVLFSGDPKDQKRNLVARIIKIFRGVKKNTRESFPGQEDVVAAALLLHDCEKHPEYLQCVEDGFRSKFGRLVKKENENAVKKLESQMSNALNGARQKLGIAPVELSVSDRLSDSAVKILRECISRASAHKQSEPLTQPETNREAKNGKILPLPEENSRKAAESEPCCTDSAQSAEKAEPSTNKKIFDLSLVRLLEAVGVFFSGLGRKIMALANKCADFLRSLPASSFVSALMSFIIVSAAAIGSYIFRNSTAFSPDLAAVGFVVAVGVSMTSISLILGRIPVLDMENDTHKVIKKNMELVFWIILMLVIRAILLH